MRSRIRPLGQRLHEPSFQELERDLHPEFHLPRRAIVVDSRTRPDPQHVARRTRRCAIRRSRARRYWLSRTRIVVRQLSGHWLEVREIKHVIKARARFDTQPFSHLQGPTDRRIQRLESRIAELPRRRHDDERRSPAQRRQLRRCKEPAAPAPGPAAVKDPACVWL